MKIIHVGRPRAIASEEEGQHAEQIGVTAEFIRGVIIFFRDSAAVGFWTRPVLAEQGALVGELSIVSVWKGHPMGSGEEQGWGLGGVQELVEVGLVRLTFHIGFYLPFWMVTLQKFSQRRDQLPSAKLCGRIVFIGRTKKNSLAGQVEASCFRLHNADSITVVIFKVIKMDASYGILDV
jgi:hypothetical protein